MKKFDISCTYCQWPECKQPHFTSKSLATQAQGQWASWFWVKMRQMSPPLWEVGTWDYACLWPCNSLILPWHLSYHNSFTWRLPAYDCPGILALAQPSLWGLRFRWGEWDCVLPEREGKGLCQPAAWANMQMYNTQLLTHCSSKHLSSCPLASISIQFSWEYSIGGLGTRLKVLPKLFNTY